MGEAIVVPMNRRKTGGSEVVNEKETAKVRNVGEMKKSERE